MGERVTIRPMKTLFIIPGFTHHPGEQKYDKLKKYFEQKGFRVIVVPITWRWKVMSDYVKQFEQIYTKNRGNENIVLGFSFGAMIALISAKNLQPDRLILCSLSPYFKEDHKDLKWWWKGVVGVNRMTDFKKYSANALAKQVKAPTMMFYGSVEGIKHPMMKKRIVAVAKLIPGTKVIVVSEAPHDIGHPEYFKAICEHVK